MEGALGMALAVESLERLGLKVAAGALATLAEEAVKNDATYVDFLLRLLEKEIQERDRRYMETCTKWARFPYKRTLSGFDFSFQPSIDERLVRELSTLAFVEKGDNLLILGPPGVGNYAKLFVMQRQTASMERFHAAQLTQLYISIRPHLHNAFNQLIRSLSSLHRGISSAMGLG